MFKKQLLTVLAVVLMTFSVKAQFYADVLVDAGPCDPIIPILCPGGVNDPLNAVDGDRENFALLRADIGLISTAYIEMGFSTLGKAGDMVFVDLQAANNNLNVDVLHSITVELFDSSGVVVGEKSSFDLTDIHLLSGTSGVYRFPIQADSTANNVASVKVTTTGLLNVLNDLRVFGASYITPSLGGDCGPFYANGLFEFQNVDNPLNAVNADRDDFALMNIALGIGTEAYIDVQFENTFTSGSFVGFEVEPENTFLLAGVIGDVSMTAYNDSGLVVDTYEEFELADLGLVANTSDRYQIGFVTNTDSVYNIKRLRLSILPTIGLLDDLRVYGAIGVPTGVDVGIITAGGRTSICEGGTIELTVQDGFDSYVWNTGETNASIVVTEPGIYTVSGSIDDCIYSASVLITQVDFQSSVAGITSPDCGEANGAIDLEVSGAGIFGYQWSNGATSQDLTDVPAGLYTCTITDSTTDCTELIYAALSSIDGPVVNEKVTNAVCGSSNGAIDLFVEGSSPFTYEWSHGPTTASVSDLSAGTYYVVVTDVFGCVTVNTISVGTESSLQLSATTVDPGCDSTNGSVDLSVAGGSGFYSYLWSTGQTSEDLDGIAAGLYTVMVSDDANGCTGELTVAVSNDRGPEVTIIEQLNTTCGLDNGAIEIATNPENGVLVTWSTGDIGVDRIENLAPGIYTVQVEDFNNPDGCSSFMVIEITEETTQLFVGSAVHHDCSDSDELEGSITLTIEGGQTPYTFVWSTGDSTQNLTGIEAGQYDVLISDAMGCSVNKTYEVELLADCSIYPPNGGGGGGSGGGNTGNGNTIDCVTDVFTPNNDGVNDTWVIDCIEDYPNHELQIFNRWGSLVYEASPYQNDWDGRFKNTGEMVPDGTYFYTINFNEGSTASGFILIVR